jgi:hypothetical protein
MNRVCTELRKQRVFRGYIRDTFWWGKNEMEDVREDNYLCPSVRGFPPAPFKFSISERMPGEGLERRMVREGDHNPDAASH